MSTLSYRAVLQRGFALVRDEMRRPVRAATGIVAGQAIAIEFHDGTVAAHTDGGAKPSKPPLPPKPGQGSLF